MAVTYGFYNSKNGDREYDAIQMSTIFDGIILDGIFQNIGTSMMVQASTGMMVTVGIGRAWFDHTWTLNDAPMPLTIDLSEVILHRIDIVALDVDAREDIRANNIIVIKGTPSSNPVPPTLIKDNDHHQYALAHIRVNAGVTEITQSAITNKVGSADTPFIVCPLEHVSVDELMAQWVTEWNEFYSAKTSEMEAEISRWENSWESFYTLYTTDMENTANYWRTTWTNTYNSYKAQFDAFYDGWVNKMDTSYSEWEGEWDTWYADFTTTNTAVMNTWRNEEQAAFDSWFAEIQTALSEDVAGNLEVQIQELQDKTDKLEETVMDYQYGPDGTLSVARFIFDSSYDPSTPDIDTNDVIMDNQNRPIKSTTRYILETPTISKNKKLIERGICLGNSITEAQADAINKGTFENIYLGDYWDFPKEDGTFVRAVVVDFNYGVSSNPVLELDTRETYPNVVLLVMKLLENYKPSFYYSTTYNGNGVHHFKNFVLPDALIEIRDVVSSAISSHQEKIVNGSIGVSYQPAVVDSSTKKITSFSAYTGTMIIPDIKMFGQKTAPFLYQGIDYVNNIYNIFRSLIDGVLTLSYFSLEGFEKLLYNTQISTSGILFSGAYAANHHIGYIHRYNYGNYQPDVVPLKKVEASGETSRYEAYIPWNLTIPLLFKIQGTTKRILPNI